MPLLRLLTRYYVMLTFSLLIIIALRAAIRVYDAIAY